MLNFLQDRELRAKLSGLALGSVMATMPTFFVSDWMWTHSAPITPNAKIGAVYEHNEHGSITYLTAFQATSSALIFWIGFVGIALAMFAIPKRDMHVAKLGGVPLGARRAIDDDKGLSRSWGIKSAAAMLLALLIVGPAMVRWLNDIGIVLNN